MSHFSKVIDVSSAIRDQRQHLLEENRRFSSILHRKSQLTPDELRKYRDLHSRYLWLYPFDKIMDTFDSKPAEPVFADQIINSIVTDDFITKLSEKVMSRIN